MMEFIKHIIRTKESIFEAIKRINNVEPLILLVINENDELMGTVTDGDIRRGLIKGFELSNKVSEIMQTHFYHLDNGIDVKKVNKLKKKNISLLPILDENNRIKKVFNLNKLNSLLPLDAVIMAGGRGERLKPITDKIPKPMIKLGDKPIIDHTIDRLISFGIENIYISVNYLKEQIMDYFGDGSQKGINIKYIEEEKPLGTAGALSLANDFGNDILLTNSDLFTNIDYEDFYLAFLNHNADMAVASIPYTVNIPYAILEEEKGSITHFKEKPSNTHYANAGIYLFKKELVNQIPQNEFFNSTDLMQKTIDANKKVIHNPLIGYWIDIGKHEDLQRAQEIVKHTSTNG